MLPICVYLSFQKTDVCGGQAPLGAVQHITYVFCPLVPGNFYTSSPESSSVHTPKPGGYPHKSKPMVLCTVQDLSFPRDPLGVPLRKRGKKCCDHIISLQREALFLMVSVPCTQHRAEQREGRKASETSKVESQPLTLPFQGAS